MVWHKSCVFFCNTWNDKKDLVNENKLIFFSSGSFGLLKLQFANIKPLTRNFWSRVLVVPPTNSFLRFSWIFTYIRLSTPYIIYIEFQSFQRSYRNQVEIFLWNRSESVSTRRDCQWATLFASVHQCPQAEYFFFFQSSLVVIKWMSKSFSKATASGKMPPAIQRRFRFNCGSLLVILSSSALFEHNFFYC